MSRIARISDCLDEGSERFGVEALASVLPQGWIRESLEAAAVRTSRCRQLPCAMTVWLVLLLALFRRLSYRNLLGMLEGSRWALRHWRGRPPPSSTALSKARDRVGVAPLAHLYRRSARAWEEAGGGRWFHGHRVKAIDGFNLKTWDSDANRAYFGAPGASRGESAFPQVRVVGCLDVGTRILTAARFAPYARSELALLDEMRADLEPGCLVLLDRGYAAYETLWDLHQHGVDFLVRLKRNMRVERIRTLGPGDFLVQIPIHGALRALRPDLPRYWTLREVVADGPPGDDETRRFLTSLLGTSIRGAEIAGLYPLRWQEEIAIDEVKTHLGDAATVNRPLILRSRTPERVKQEIHGYLIAYNAVRRLMVEAAAPAAGTTEPQSQTPEPTIETVDPLRLSFTTTLERLREAIRDMARLPPYLLQDRFDEFQRAVRRAYVTPRPGRSYPRAVRVKMSNYPLKRRHAG
ncbi:MAG: IS4 family transposase [Planctomycetaceae bacterium]